MDTVSLFKFSKGHNPFKHLGGEKFLFSAHCPMGLYICTKLCENISADVSVIEWLQFPTKIFKGA